MTKIIIQGIAGRMGRAVYELIAQREDCEVVAGVDRIDPGLGVPVAARIEELPVRGDVLIDFSSPEATRAALAYCRGALLPCVICTTGLTEEDQALIRQAAKTIPVFQSANMSLGINLLMDLAQKAARLLGPGYDVEIIEKHHHNKLDAPSGTALMLLGAIQQAADTPYEPVVYGRHAAKEKRGAREIGIHAVRGGSIVGEHEVLFCGPDEVITLSHSAGSRSVFANGAVNAALFLVNSANKVPGLYSMKELIQSL